MTSMRSRGQASRDATGSDEPGEPRSKRGSATNKVAFRPFQLRWREPIGKDECPYLVRWVFSVFGWSIRVHKWLASDDQRYFHDHSFDFFTFILKGGYIDRSPTESGVRVQHLGPGDLHFRPAEYKHMVEVKPGGCVSLLLCGPPRRKFGFWIPGRDKVMRPLRYFARYGHHPCEDRPAQ